MDYTINTAISWVKRYMPKPFSHGYMKRINSEKISVGSIDFMDRIWTGIIIDT